MSDNHIFNMENNGIKKKKKSIILHQGQADSSKSLLIGSNFRHRFSLSSQNGEAQAKTELFCIMIYIHTAFHEIGQVLERKVFPIQKKIRRQLRTQHLEFSVFQLETLRPNCDNNKAPYSGVTLYLDLCPCPYMFYIFQFYV